MDPESDGHAADVAWFCCIHYGCEIHKKKKNLHQVSPTRFHQIYPMVNPYTAIEGRGYIPQQDGRTASEFLLKKDPAIPEACWNGGPGRDCLSPECPFHAQWKLHEWHKLTEMVTHSYRWQVGCVVRRSCCGDIRV